MSRTVLIALVCLAAVAAVGAGTYAYTRGTATPDAVRQAVPAPIDRVEILVQGSSATAKISAGLPSGCAKVDSHSLKRSGDTFTVTVLNSMPTGNPICTAVYGMYELSVDLGNDLRPGTTYTLVVNDKTSQFKT